MATTYGYDTAGRLNDLLHAKDTATLQRISYAKLDNNGNREQVTDTTGVTTYGYDALNRIDNAQYPAIPSGPGASAISYVQDAVGNLSNNGTTTFTHDTSDRITNPEFRYDMNGNLESDGAATFEYNSTNQLVKVVRGGTTTTYGYDGNGNLIEQTVNGVKTTLVLDERGSLARVLGEVRANGEEVRYAYGPDGVAAQQTVGADGTAHGILYPLLDGQGSVRNLTDPTGAVVLSRSYDAWGNVRHTSGTATTSLGYAGEWQDGASGLVYLRARFYHPALARFLQRDTWAGTSARPQSLNRYAYAENNPATYADPSGHAVDENGHWTPCNILSDCTAQDYKDWWGSDDGDRARQFARTVAQDVAYGVTMGPVDLAVGMLTHPIRTTQDMVKSPFKAVRDMVQGALCGDMEQMAHGVTGYGGFAVGGSLAVSELGWSSEVESSLADDLASRSHFKGTDKPWTTGATPDSAYTHFDPKTGKPKQTALYDENGNVSTHIDWKQHGTAPPGHYHTFPEPGNPASGHGPGKPHHDPKLPSDWGLPLDWDIWP